jgi:hypothetical protein
MAITRDAYRQTQAPYDPDEPSLDSIERYEEFGKLRPVAWIIGGVLAAAMVISLFSVDGRQVIPQATQTSENSPIPPVPMPMRPN